MPVFFIDVHDGRETLIDTAGIELVDQHEAADTAAALLPDFARDIIPDGQANSFAASVRTASGDVVYRALMLFCGQWANRPRGEDSLDGALSYEAMRSAELRREALALKARFSGAIPALMEVLEQTRATYIASHGVRDHRSEEA